MLYPSIDKLIEKVDSKYTLVAIASKRARMMRDQNSSYLEDTQSHKEVGIALEEIVADEIEFENPYVDKERNKFKP